ncbi:MAG TPA: hypothetical protein VD838_00585 [Anaeromyxobacteraceae bacterium]|nr:hypothetical protein [Anaeromyxobacteraceae bacterium]
MDREQLLEALKDPSTADAKTVAKALQKHAQPIYQEIFNRGHSQATEKLTAEKEAVEAQLEAAEEKATKAEAKAKKLEEGSPDVAKVTEQFQQEIADLKEKHKLEKKALETKVVDVQLQTYREKAIAKLVAADVDPAYAEVLLERQANRDRLKLDKDGKLSILQAGKDIPIAAEDGTDALDAFVQELAGATPANFKTSNGDRGAGATNAASGGAGGYDPVKDGQARAEAQKKNADSDLAFR